MVNPEENKVYSRYSIVELILLSFYRTSQKLHRDMFGEYIYQYVLSKNIMKFNLSLFDTIYHKIKCLLVCDI